MLSIDEKTLSHIEQDIAACEQEYDVDDAESIITNERYTYITSIIDSCLSKAKTKDNLTTSDKIDRIVTDRWLALPIFAIVMFIVYYVSVTTVGTWATDWANDGVFGDGWSLFSGLEITGHTGSSGKFPEFYPLRGLAAGSASGRYRSRRGSGAGFRASDADSLYIPRFLRRLRVYGESRVYHG